MEANTHKKKEGENGWDERVKNVSQRRQRFSQLSSAYALFIAPLRHCISF